MQKQFDVIIRSLRTSLKNYGIDRIFELKRGSMRIRPELFTCDAYRFFSGDIDAVTAATISSRAVLRAISRAYDAFSNFNSGNTYE